MKYARSVDHSTAQDGSDMRYIDIVEIPNPLPSWAQDAAAFLAKMFPDVTGFVRVPDDTGDIPAPSPVPNNHGNPYFGKLPLARKDFFALVGQTLSPDRYKRIMGDSHFLWVKDVLDGVDVVDVDDRSGQFLKIVTYLLQTNGDDARVLMTTQELSAIMTAWK